MFHGCLDLPFCLRFFSHLLPKIAPGLGIMPEQFGVPSVDWGCIPGYLLTNLNAQQNIFRLAVEEFHNAFGDLHLLLPVE